MVTIEELKLGNKTLEALKFLLLQINELDVILNELNFEELREANNQAKTQIEVLNNIKILVLNTEKSIEQAKALIDSRSDEVNIAKREIEDAKTNIIKAKDDATLIYENISSKSERIEQKYNDIAGIKKEVDKKFDDIKNIEDQSRDIANEITNNKNITLKKIDENVNTLNNTISNINILKNETLQEIASTKASIDTKANEALSQASTALTDIRGIIADFRGKQTELNALKASLETLKSSLENLNKSGLINDTQAGIAQTYSSNKINNLLQGVLRESDASESNANGKLVKRNAQGNIYATNVYLNATTKAEVSDIKNSLATDKWRFIVRDTGEGLLRSMSIKDFINSQEVDAYGKTESDNRYLAKSEASTDNASNTLVKRGADGNISINNIKISDTGSDIEMIRDIERDTQSPYQLLIRKTKDEPIKLMNLQNFIGRLMFYTQGNISTATAPYLKKTDAETTYLSKKEAENSYLKANTPAFNNYLRAEANNDNEEIVTLKTPKGHSFKKLQISTLGFNKPSNLDYTSPSNPTLSFVLAKDEGGYTNTIYTQSVSDLRPFIESVARYKIFGRDSCNQEDIDLSKRVNLEVNYTRQRTFLLSGTITDNMVGQSGVILVYGAKNIIGWESRIVWREVPTDLKDTEIFAYYISFDKKVYMGRA
jgi:hypothetical protein